MTRFIRRLALYVLVGISVAGMALAQTPEVQEAPDDEAALEEALEALDDEEALDAALEAQETPEDKAALEALVPRTGYFRVYRFLPGIHCFDWADWIAMDQYETHGYLNNGAVLIVSMYGDDPTYDDLLLGPFVARLGTPGPYIYATSQGIQVYWFGCTDTEVLDEDIGGDELYVDAVVFDGDGGVLRAFESHRVYGNY